LTSAGIERLVFSVVLAAVQVGIALYVYAHTRHRLVNLAFAVLGMSLAAWTIAIGLATALAQEGPRVLLIEDDPTQRERIRSWLESQQWQISEAENGRVALDRLAGDVPDIILLDLMMPVMDGSEVSRRLRADPVTADIPIVVMSAQDRLHATFSLMTVDDRLAKPFALAGLYTTVARWAQTP